MTGETRGQAAWGGRSLSLFFVAVQLYVQLKARLPRGALQRAACCFLRETPTCGIGPMIGPSDDYSTAVKLYTCYYGKDLLVL